MNRPLHIWTIFAACLAVVFAAMTWVSGTALRLDRAQGEAQRQAQFEEKVRLALWRMDSLLAPLVVQESARPYFHYRAFHPAERAYNRMFGELQQGDVLVPSPLLAQTSSNVLLHFQFAPDGALSSPQVPEEARQQRANRNYLEPETATTNAARLAQLRQMLSYPMLLAACPSASSSLSEASWIAQTPAGFNSLANNANPKTAFPPSVPASEQQAVQVFQNNVELQARANTYRQQIGNYGANSGKAAAPGISVSEGPMKPVWFGHSLVLARRVRISGQDYLQGCWLDWPGLQRTLLEGVKDLLPQARLEPWPNSAVDEQARLLASLPVRLIADNSHAFSAFSFSPVFFELVVSWLCMFLAAAAVGVLLHGAVSLSERRGAFVSAVTHELRTPLTTFKMYSEMLADGMVTDETKRQQYLATLCAEANRLSHLVENVLAYARLERGRARDLIERITLGELLERVAPRLRERAERAGMQLAVDAEEHALQTVAHVDAGAVEQILFNLVDNACKYAGPGAAEKTIHLEALPEGKFAMLRVRDHGQGISAEGARRLFQPFSKSAQEAAHSAPGIGLGLALCRRLSRSLGGDLRLVPSAGGGACFELRLPLGSHGSAAALASV